MKRKNVAPGISKKQLSIQDSRVIELKFKVKSETLFLWIPSTHKLWRSQKWHFEVFLDVIWESQRIWKDIKCVTKAPAKMHVLGFDTYKTPGRAIHELLLGFSIYFKGKTNADAAGGLFFLTKRSRLIFSLFPTTHFLRLPTVDWDPHQLVLSFICPEGMPGHPEAICRHLINFQVLLGWHFLWGPRKETLWGNWEDKKATTLGPWEEKAPSEPFLALGGDC